MSTYIDPDKAHVWLDGNAWRAPADTALPANIFASSLAGWSPFGAIKAGFVVTTSQDVTDIDVWNNRTGVPYKRIKKPPSVSIKMRPVDMSAATALTLIRGGSIAAGGGGFEMVDGGAEEFGLILVVEDGADKKAYFGAKCELLNVPEESMGADDDVEGWDLEIGPLAPADGSAGLRRFLNTNPLA